MSSNNLEDPGVMEVTGRVLVATIIALVVVLILVFLFHVYARWLWHRRRQAIDGANNNNHRPLDHHHAGVTVLRRGLDSAFLKTLPLMEFDSKDFKDGLECSVCLSELQQGEKTRILPKCNHAFHAECIDMWFHSHSTCPICRNPVSEQAEVSVESLLENQEMQTQTANNNGGDLPTNVLFWGDETEVSTLTSQLEEANNNHQTPILPFEPATSSSSSSASSTSESNNKDRLKPDLVIDIPAARQGGDDEDERTPIMKSLRRILSTSRRFNPFSPGSSEQPQT